ncbi:Histone deacetylase domain [Phytophthora cactorum]|nr:Histone deacetylase domain [Phytophthora cactorum]
MLVVSTPQAFEDVLKYQFMNFPKGPHFKDNMKDLLGGGIFAVDGVKWAHQCDVARELFRAQELQLPFQAAFDRAQRLTTQRFVRPRWFWKMQKRLGLGAEDQLQLDIKEIDTTVLSIVQQVLANRALTPEDGRAKNASMLSLFLDIIAKSPKTEEHQYDPVYLRDVVVNFLVAGRDTTAQALSWFFYNASQNPRVETKLRREIYTKLPELMAAECCVPTLQQYAVRDTVLSDGTFVPAGTMVCLPLYAMGRMTHVWGPDAAEFKPERWINPSTKTIISVSAFKFVAFNAGPRMCLGNSLAGLELKLVAALYSPRRNVVYMHSPTYLDALSRLPVHQQRERMTVALLEACFPDGELSQYLQLLAPTIATRGQLEAFHSRDYIDALYEFGAGRESRRLSAQDQELLEESGLVDDAYDDEKVLPPAAINLGGGRHHAMRSQASGFCYVNDVVLGVQRLLSKGKMKRVLVLDIDVHHGDGTQEAFYYSEQVTTISFHLREPGFFPGTGADTEVGAGRGRRNNVNVPLQRGITDDQFHGLFQRVVSKAVETVQPEVLVLVCGVNTLARDPLGGFNLTSDGICDSVEAIMALQLPVLCLGAGGYSGADASKTFAAIIATVIGQRQQLPEHIPEHDFYEEYLPNMQLVTTPVAHRPNLNTAGTLRKTEDCAFETLEQFALDRRTRIQQVSKKRPMTAAQIGFVRTSSDLVEDATTPID